MKRRMAHIAAVFSVFTMVSYAGMADAGPAMEVVKTKQSALFDLLKQSSNANQQKVSALFDEMLDYSALAEASLGSEWAARSNAEKAEFTDLLKQLVRKAYEKNLKKTLNFTIEYLSEDVGDAATLVKTKAVPKTNARADSVEIAFKMVEKAGVWRVTDIVTEGVSLVSSYRNQFTKIIKKDGFPKLVTKMKEKINKPDELAHPRG